MSRRVASARAWNKRSVCLRSVLTAPTTIWLYISTTQRTASRCRLDAVLEDLLQRAWDGVSGAEGAQEGPDRGWCQHLAAEHELSIALAQRVRLLDAVASAQQRGDHRHRLRSRVRR